MGPLEEIIVKLMAERDALKRMNKRTDRLAMRRSVFLFYIVNILSDVSASSFCSCDENSTTYYYVILNMATYIFLFLVQPGACTFLTIQKLF